jgi:serine/threonine-protein kinase HipA
LHWKPLRSLATNKHDHAKNFSFLYQDGAWKVSPGYDLLPSDGFNGNYSSTINGNGTPTMDDCLVAAKKASFPVKQAKLVVSELLEEIKK